MDEFVTKLIDNVAMLNKLDENGNKLLLLDLNVSNFLLGKNVNNFFFPTKMSIRFHSTKMSINYHYWIKMSVIFY